jgi:hypothetical protein
LRPVDLDAPDADSLLLQALRVRGVAAADATAFTIQHDGMTVSLEYVFGSYSVVGLRVPYPSADRVASGAGFSPSPLAARRPLSIALRLEDDHDRRAKARGRALEAQVGDPTFDREVYIDSPSPEAARAVLTHGVREAALALLRGGVRDLELDDEAGFIRVSIGATEHVRYWSERPDQLLGAIVALARHAPPVRHVHLPRPFDPRWWLGALALTSFVALAASAGVLLPRRCIEPCGDDGGQCFRATDSVCTSPLPIGLGVAVGVAVALELLVVRRVPIGSSSHRTSSPRLLSFALALLVGLLAGVLLGWGKLW